MRRTAKLFLIGVLLFLISVGAVYAAEYYPLHAGDVRYLDNIPYIVGDIEEVNGIPYFPVIHATFSYHCRKDDSGRVYWKLPGKEEQLVYDFTADVGQKWNCTLWGMDFIVTLTSKTDTVTADFQAFSNCYTFQFTAINAYDADYADSFAPDIGLVQRSTCWEMIGPLIKARIDGRNIPAERPSPRVTRTIPEDEISAVPVDSYIRIFFTWYLRSSSVTGESFRVVSRKEGILGGAIGKSDSASADIISFFPAHPFSYGDTIEVTLTPDICDYLGDPLSEQCSFSFSTEFPNTDTPLFHEDKESIVTDLRWGDFDWGDCDNDGDTDLIIFGSKNNTGHVEWFENQDGNFVKHEIGSIDIDSDLGFGRNSIRWIDYNGDGLMDFAAAGIDSLGGRRTLFYHRSGNGFVKDAMELPFGYASLDCYDYNNDGRQDLLISGLSWTVDHRTAVYRNDGGRFTMLDNTSFPWDAAEIVHWLDDNGDGKKEILAIGPDQLSNSVFFSFNGVSFINEGVHIQNDSMVDRLYYCDNIDLHKDGDMDMIIGPYLLMREGNSFNISKVDNYFNGAIPKFCDVDRDGNFDLLIAGEKEDAVHRNREYIQVFRNQNGDLSLAKEINIGRDFLIFSGRWIDLNSDGRPDLTLFTNDGFIIYTAVSDLLTEVKAVDTVAPEKFRLNVHPNPFNPSTTITYFLPEAGTAVLTVYNIAGQKVSELSHGYETSGTHSAVFDGSKFSSGIYFCRLRTGNRSMTQKMTLVK
jgi:hypothetical protein